MSEVEVKKAYFDLFNYVRGQVEQARQNENHAELMHMAKIATHYRVARTCYEDILRVLEFMADQFGIEVNS